MKNQLNELRSLASHAENRRTETGIPRVAMVQGEIPEHLLAAVYDPMINLILQGSKSMTVGDRTLRYDPATYFVMSIELPAVGQVHPTPSGEPYLAVSLTLDPTVLATLLADLPKPIGHYDKDAGFSVAAVTSDLMDAWVRMLRLMTRPEDIAALAPVYEREILYRVLQGPHGWMLRDIAAPDSAMARVSLAIQYIRREFAKPIRVESLADIAAMSVSAFHRHFKAVTALSPLQYQKRVRLLQARTQLVAHAKTVTRAAFEVGYESATQFSRDYARVFGLPPARDAARIIAETRGPRMSLNSPFSGAKIVVLCEGKLLTYLRDDTPAIPWPGLWDLPGGGREGGETPVQCALRETEEEFGLRLDPACITWSRVYPGQGMGGLDTWFFVAEVPPGTFAKVVFGDEGQYWEVAAVEDFLTKHDAIAPLQRRLREFLSSLEVRKT